VQIVGGTLEDSGRDGPVTNFQTERSPADYALMYKKDGLGGGHVISLGPGNHEAALSALRAWPGGLQMGGGVTPGNAAEYLDAGASHVIVTSYVFSEGRLDEDRLDELVSAVGKDRLVLDLSCRKRGADFWIVADRWRTFTDTAIGGETLGRLAGHCDEFLVHGVDVEGKMSGIQTELVEILGRQSPIPATYAGGAQSLDDLDRVKEIGRGRVDLSIGSAMDIFGGDVAYRDVVAWQRANAPGDGDAS
jgi:phosphoribosylformimino-5-aminoimidazole carboxamide ribotide isomerase